ncbi:hypothetical protein LTR27_000724 [Elasticomyces elasticus]|nr:hypothetical protein LTR27_000724 [Elasticomyces elasticus]
MVELLGIAYLSKQQGSDLKLSLAASEGQLRVFRAALDDTDETSFAQWSSIAYARDNQIPQFLTAIISHIQRFKPFEEVCETLLGWAVFCGHSETALLLSAAESFSSNGQLDSFLSMLEDPNMSWYRDLPMSPPPKLSASVSAGNLITTAVQQSHLWSTAKTAQVFCAVLPDGPYELPMELARSVIEVVVVALHLWPKQAVLLIRSVLRRTPARESLLPLYAKATREMESRTNVGTQLMSLLKAERQCDFYRLLTMERAYPHARRISSVETLVYDAGGDPTTGPPAST